MTAGKAALVSTVLAALFAFALNNTAQAQDRNPRQISFSVLLSSVNNVEAHVRSFQARADLRLEDIRAVNVANLIQSASDFQTMEQALTRHHLAILNLRVLLSGNPIMEEALRKLSIPIEQVLAINVQPDGSVLVFHRRR